MKVDFEKAQKTTYTFNKKELIEMLIEGYQKKSGRILADIDYAKCKLYANNKETNNVELVVENKQQGGEDFNGNI
jgi:hypothetical protein